MSNIFDEYEFRSILPDEADQAVLIEHICFPPNEACKEECMKERIEHVPDLFLVAVDKKTGKLAGFLNGIASNEKAFRDEFFLQCELNEPDGKNVMILGLDVLPEHRKKGLARALMNKYIERETINKRECLILTCLEEKVDMYKRMGFVDNGIAGSSWGGEQWHEMSNKFA